MGRMLLKGYPQCFLANVRVRGSRLTKFHHRTKHDARLAGGHGIDWALVHPDQPGSMPPMQKSVGDAGCTLVNAGHRAGGVQTSPDCGLNRFQQFRVARAPGSIGRGNHRVQGDLKAYPHGPSSSGLRASPCIQRCRLLRLGSARRRVISSESAFDRLYCVARLAEARARLQ